MGFADELRNAPDKKKQEEQLYNKWKDRLVKIITEKLYQTLCGNTSHFPSMKFVVYYGQHT